MVFGVLEEDVAFIFKVEVSHAGLCIDNVGTVGGLGCGETKNWPIRF